MECKRATRLALTEHTVGSEQAGGTLRAKRNYGLRRCAAGPFEICSSEGLP